MKNKLLIVWLCLVLLLQAQSSIPSPEPDPPCESDYALLFSIPDCKYCSGGDYHLFACRVTKDNGIPSLLFKSICLSSVRSVQHLSFLPLVTKCEAPAFMDNGHCVILGDPIAP